MPCPASSPRSSPSADSRTRNRTRYSFKSTPRYRSTPRKRFRLTASQAGDAIDDFGNTYIRAWQVEAWLAPTLRSYIELWPSVPGWTLYLARQGTVPVGVGVSFDNGKVAYLADAATIPEYRRRGVQGALIMQRIADARQTSARFAFSRAEFGTASQRNLERAGLQSRYMVSIWTKMVAA